MNETPGIHGDVASRAVDAMRLRRAPKGGPAPAAAPIVIKIALDQDGKLPPEPLTGSGSTAPLAIELTVETTDAGGEHPYWFDDIWWTDVIARWADETVTVIIAPTPYALLHPVLLYQLAMLRRVVPGWRLVGVAYRTDFDLGEDVLQPTGHAGAASSPYHELRIIDAPRRQGRFAVGSVQSDRLADRAVESLLASLRREQSAAGVTSPILVRLPADSPQTDTADRLHQPASGSAQGARASASAE